MKFKTVALGLLAAAALLSGCDLTAKDPVAAARAHIERHDPKAAVITLKTALQKQPDAAATRFLLGKILLDTGEVVAALLELQKALDLGHEESEVVPQLVKAMAVGGRAKEATDRYAGKRFSSDEANAELQVALAAAWGMQGQPERMRAAVDRALESAPRHAVARVMKANFLAGAGDLDGAWKANADALAANPKLAAAWQFQGMLLRHHKRDLPEAIKAQREALKNEPTLLTAHTELLSMLWELNDKDGMRKQLAEMQKALPRNLNTFLYSAQIEFLDGNLKRSRELVQQLLRAKQPDVRALLLAGQIEVRNGALTLAETHFTRALNEAPNFAQLRLRLAATQLRLGQTDKALTTLQPLIEVARPSSDALALAAEAFLHAGNAARANSYFEQALKASPEDPRLRAAVALNRIAQGQAAEGLSALEGVASQDKGTFADLALISTLMSRRDYGAATAAIDRLQKKEPTKPLFALLRGQVLLEQKDRVGARKSFAQALEIDPPYYPAAKSLAQMDFEDGKLPEAKKRFEALLAKDPANFRALLTLAELKSRNREPETEVMALLGEAVKKNPAQWEPRVALVEYQLNKGDFKAAQSSGQDALAVIPDNPALLDAVGRAQAAVKEYQQALSTFRKVATLLPQSPQPHLRMADVYAARDDRAAAIASLQRALELSPNLLSAQSRQVQLLVADKNHKEALAVARRVQQASPKEGVGHLLEADIHSSLKQWENAASALKASLSRTPSTEAAIKLHAVTLRLGRSDEASRLASDWRTQHPKDMAFVLHLASTALQAKDWPRSEALYREVLGALPDHLSANNNIAWSLMNQKKPGALPFAEKASRLAPKDPSITDTLAMALADAGQVDKALELQKKVVAMAPGLMEAKLNLARIALRSGDKALARAELEKLAYEGNKFNQQAEVAQLLRSLQ